jgi:hypothetical protein
MVALVWIALALIIGAQSVDRVMAPEVERDRSECVCCGCDL